MSEIPKNLFTSLQVGRMNLQHRIVMAPMSRFRAKDGHVPSAEAIRYYQQRASYPGTLIITEGTFISPGACGFFNAPGIFNEEQIQAWRRITDTVHTKGCFLYLQLWAVGRAADPKYITAQGIELFSSSDVPLSSSGPKPRAQTLLEIQECIMQYSRASENAIAAGFDGVEIHGANGYLVDQYIQAGTNRRLDAYGGSLANRAKFALEVVYACVSAIGADRVAIRLSPWSPFLGMGMSDPVPTFSYLIQNLPRNLAYLHGLFTSSDTPRLILVVIEGGIAGNDDVVSGGDQSVEFARSLWSGPFFSAGGHGRETALAMTDKYENTAVVFGRHFTSNPDLVAKIELGMELSPYDRSTFYTGAAEGYTTYAADESLVLKAMHLGDV